MVINVKINRNIIQLPEEIPQKINIINAKINRNIIQLPEEIPQKISAEINRVIVTLPEVEEKGWLEKLLEFIKDRFQIIPAPIEAAIKGIYLLVTDEELTESKFNQLELEITDFFVPVNALAKLFTGQNLKGEVEEFGSGEDWLDIILSAVPFIPAAKAGKTTAKLALKGISKTEAASLTSKLGNSATIKQLLKIVTDHPETSGKFLAKFPQPVREAVISGLGKTAEGRIAIVTLSKLGYFKLVSSGWNKIMKAAFTFGAISAGIFLPIFALTEIPNYFLMRTFARKSIAQQQGEYAPDFSFQLNEFEKSLQTITFELENNIKDGNLDSAKENLIALENIVNNFETFIGDKKEIMFTEDYDLSIELIEFYKRLISDRLENLDVAPPISEEDEWDKIMQEREQRREAERIAEEERWNKIIADAEERKRIARAEDQERWQKVIDEADRRKQLTIIEDQERWDAIQREQEQRRQDQILADEALWNEINFRNQERKDAERAEEQAYWDNIFLENEARELRDQEEFVSFKKTPALSSSLLNLPFAFTPSPKEIAPDPDKEILINIETTDLKPWKGRIFSIALLDLSVPNAETLVLSSDNEEEIIAEFIRIFNEGNYKKLVGFKLIFDYRYIFNKLMLYRMQSKKFKDIKLKDVKQLMDQVKEEFVYFPDKSGKLDDYGKELLGKGKMGKQENLLRMYLAGNFDYVRAFQERQIEVTKGLYDLFRFSSSEGFISPISNTSHGSHETETNINPIDLQTERTKPCKVCIQTNSLDATECIACGNKL